MKTHDTQPVNSSRISHASRMHAKSSSRHKTAASGSTKAVFIVLTCMLAIWACVGLTSCKNASKTVSVGVLTDIPGMSSMNPEDGTFSGFEVDFARELFERIYGSGTQVNFAGVSGNTREPELNAKAIDALIACYSITDERKQTYNISASYYDAPVMVLVKNDSSFSSIGDMDGRTIGVLGDSTNATALLAYTESNGVTVFPSGYDTFEQARAAVDSGVVDGFSTDSIVLYGYLDDSYRLLPDKFSTQSYGVVTRKDDSKLAESIDEALVSMKSDGTLASLKEKWGL